MKYPLLTSSEFQTLVLIFAAHADYKYLDSEKAFIQSHSDPKEYKKMLELFNDNSDYYILKTVLENKKNACTNQEKTAALYLLITELFKVDGDYSRSEKVFLEFLDKMINN